MSVSRVVRTGIVGLGVGAAAGPVGTLPGVGLRGVKANGRNGMISATR